MPPSQARPWSTQYKDDYKNRTRPPAKAWTRSPSRKGTAAAPKTRLLAPNATAVYYPGMDGSYPLDGAYSGAVTGLDNEVDLDFAVTGTAAAMNTRDVKGITQSTQTETPLPAVKDDIPAVPEAIDHTLELQSQKTSNPIETYHWSQWPEPKPPDNPRPHTSIGFHRAPPSGADDKKGRCASPTPSYDPNSQQQLITRALQPMQFDPELKSWVNSSNDYEKQAIGNMMTTLGRSNTFYYNEPVPNFPPKSPVRDTYTAYQGHRPSYANLNPTGFYNQSFYPHNSQPGGREDLLVQGYAKRMEHQDPLPNIVTDRINRYPLTSRRPKYPSLSEDYMHQHSMFMTTTPRVHGHYIINPDWVSERSGLRRSLTSLSTIQPWSQKRQPVRYGVPRKNGLRY